MFCGNCGTENADNAKFCKNCGNALSSSQGAAKTALSQGSSNNNTENNAASNAPRVDAGQSDKKVKSLPIKLLAGIGVAIAAVIVIIIIAVNKGSTINLNDYLLIEAEGYDGYGTARAKVNWDAIEAKYGKKLSFTSQAQKEYGGLISIVTPAEALQDCVSVELDSYKDLSNGDTLKYTWDVDEDLTKYVKCKIKYRDGSYTVSSLTEIGTFDAFADLEVNFLGVGPDGSVNINYNGSELSYYDFDCDRTSGLSNGDTIKITISNSKLEYCAENLGKVPESLEKEYTVEGLSSYLTKLSEISFEGLDTMHLQASDVYNAHVAQSWGDNETLESFTYIGNYLLTSKNTDSYWGSRNTLYLVYKVQVRDVYSNDGKTYNKVNDIYWYIAFDNLMVDADGNLVIDITNYRTPSDRFTIDSGISSGWWSTESWYYYGYQTLDALYKEVVASNMDSYNHEDNVDESKAPVSEGLEPALGMGYVLPGSDTELLSKADLEGMSAEECKLARNEIYARHGRKFNDEELQTYFDACDWYEGTIEPDDFQESDLSDTEIANKDLIVEYEKEKGYR